MNAQHHHVHSQPRRLATLQVAQHHRQHFLIGDAKRRLHREHVVAPPRPTTPPEGSGPDVRVLRHASQHALNGRPARRVAAAGILANDALLAMLLEPLGCSGNALGADGGAHAVRVRAGAVAVQVLVHLVDNVVGGVGQAEETGAVAAGDPGPGACVDVAFDEDGLGGGAGGADAVDGGLVEGDDELLVHVVVFVVGVEQDVGVGGELAG